MSIFKIAAFASIVLLAVAARGFSQDAKDRDAIEEAAAKEDSVEEDAVGGEEDASEESSEAAPIDGKWLEAIDRLGGDSFADRKRAADELIAGGAEAIPAMEYGLDQGDVEVRERSIDLLRKATKSADLDVREQARAALLRKSIPLAPKQADPAADLQAQMFMMQQRQAAIQQQLQRQRAQQAQGLVPGAPPRMGNQIFPAPGFRPAPGFAPPGARPPGGLVPGPGAMQGSMSIRESNGVRDIEVTQNGTKVTAKQLADGSITGEITKTVDGKETTEKFSAKNTEELATKSPEAAERLSKALKTLDDIKPKP
jgi:hypothetical protein